MKTFISMLRAINVGGQNKIPMPELKRLYEGLSLTNVTTYVQSGNVVFDSIDREPDGLAAEIQTRIEKVYGSKIFVFVRAVADFRRILESNPFLMARNEAPSFLHVTFLSQTPSQAQWDNLRAPDSTGDEFFSTSQEIYLFCPDGYGRTKLSNAFFERKLGLPATTRNWNTVQALYKLAVER